MGDEKQDIETQDIKPAPQPTLEQLMGATEGMGTTVQRDRFGGKRDEGERKEELRKKQ